VLQTIQFLCEMSRVPQGAFPAILFVEIVGIGLPFELNEMSGTFRFVTTVVMVGMSFSARQRLPVLFSAEHKQLKDRFISSIFRYMTSLWEV
jgi:hypothetical protein